MGEIEINKSFVAMGLQPLTEKKSCDEFLTVTVLAVLVANQNHISPYFDTLRVPASDRPSTKH